MTLIPTPQASLGDAAVTRTLAQAVGIINPLLDALAADPVGLKGRTADFEGNPVARALDAVTWALNAADVPGTPAWASLSADDRIDWWVHRVGALTTVAVAFPGVLGVVARALPVGELLGFASQAIVLVAVGRELGVTDTEEQARLLAAVLCRRDTSRPGQPAPDQQVSEQPDESLPRTPLGLVRAVWRLAGVFDAIGDELGRRPRPRAPLRYLAMLPAVGAVASYVGENLALRRAARDARRWIRAHHTDPR